MSTMFRDFGSIDAMPSHIESTSRMFGLSAGKSAFRPSLLSQDSSRLKMQFGSSNNIDYISDQRHRTSVVQTSTLGGRSFGLQSRSSSSYTSIIPDCSFRLNQEIRQRNNNTSSISKPFWPAVRNTTLTTGLQMRDSVKYDDDDIIDNDGFRRPSALRIIRGRSSTLSTRLFHPQNTDRHYKDLSSINGFNVSHISRREVDTLSESRLPLGVRSNWMENQSLSGSVISVVSMKAQFMNLLENLHHSILSIGPHVSAEAVRMEFDKVKQGVENISEMSFAPSIKPTDSASVVSQSSKYICPPINSETTTGAAAVTNTIDGGSLHLKSCQDLLKTLVSSQSNYKKKKKMKLSTHAEEAEEGDAAVTSSRTTKAEDEGNSSFVSGKARAYARKTPRMKINAPPAVKKSVAKGVKAAIGLKQWYPIAVGSDLAFAGVDEKGAPVKTDAVRKRLNNRKVELVSGVDCNLIGSPSSVVSVLPQKIVTRLKNGLTDRWRMLQKELLNCQTAEGEMSASGASKSLRAKRAGGEHGRAKPKKESPRRPRVISTPVKKAGVSGRHTRSGRTVKRPGMFWLANGSNEITSTLGASEATIEELPRKTPRRSSERSPSKKLKKTPSVSPKQRKKATEETPATNKKAKRSGNAEGSSVGKSKASAVASARTLVKANEESPREKQKKSSPETPMRSGRRHLEEKKVEEASPWRKAESPRKSNKATKGSSSKKYNRKAIEESPRRKAKAVASPAKGKAAGDKRSSKTPKRKSPKVRRPKGKTRNESKAGEVEVHSSTEEAKVQRSRHQRGGKRKREVAADADSVLPKKSKLEKKTKTAVESTENSTEFTSKSEKKKKTGLPLSSRPPKPRGGKSQAAKNKKETAAKKTVKSASESHNETTEFTEFEKNFEFKLDDIEIPEIGDLSSNPKLSRSQLRLVSMETPPLKYFNSNLKLIGSTTPMRSPDWCISQRTESEVKQFQRRREEAFKKRIKMNVQKTVITEKNGQSKDVKRVMEWVSEKAVRSPQWNSKVLQYVIPSRKRMEQDEDDEDVETEFF